MDYMGDIYVGLVYESLLGDLGLGEGTCWDFILFVNSKSIYNEYVRY